MNNIISLNRDVIETESDHSLYATVGRIQPSNLAHFVVLYITAGGGERVSVAMSLSQARELIRQLADACITVRADNLGGPA